MAIQKAGQTAGTQPVQQGAQQYSAQGAASAAQVRPLGINPLLPVQLRGNLNVNQNPGRGLAAGVSGAGQSVGQGIAGGFEQKWARQHAEKMLQKQLDSQEKQARLNRENQRQLKDKSLQLNAVFDVIKSKYVDAWNQYKQNAEFLSRVEAEPWNYIEGYDINASDADKRAQINEFVAPYLYQGYQKEGVEISPEGTRMMIPAMFNDQSAGLVMDIIGSQGGLPGSNVVERLNGADGALMQRSATWESIANKFLFNANKAVANLDDHELSRWNTQISKSLAYAQSQMGSSYEGVLGTFGIVSRLMPDGSFDTQSDNLMRRVEKGAADHIMGKIGSGASFEGAKSLEIFRDYMNWVAGEVPNNFPVRWTDHVTGADGQGIPLEGGPPMGMPAIFLRAGADGAQTAITALATNRDAIAADMVQRAHATGKKAQAIKNNVAAYINAIILGGTQAIGLANTRPGTPGSIEDMTRLTPKLEKLMADVRATPGDKIAKLQALDRGAEDLLLDIRGFDVQVTQPSYGELLAKDKGIDATGAPMDLLDKIKLGQRATNALAPVAAFEALSAPRRVMEWFLEDTGSAESNMRTRSELARKAFDLDNQNPAAYRDEIEAVERALRKKSVKKAGAN